jgi:hypothetical protein
MRLPWLIVTAPAFLVAHSLCKAQCRVICIELIGIRLQVHHVSPAGYFLSGICSEQGQRALSNSVAQLAITLRQSPPVIAPKCVKRNAYRTTMDENS